MRLRAGGDPVAPETTLACYVSGHGFGHATRALALLRALRERSPRLRVEVRTQAPHWIFSERDRGLRCSAAPIDPGVMQTSSLDLDRAASLAAHEAFVAAWDEHVRREAAWLRECGARLVVGDVPPLAFAAAAHAGLPSVAVANFSWEWIFGCWAEQEPRWAPIARRYAEAHARAELAFRLPFHGEGDFASFRRVVDAGLLVNRARRSRRLCRAALGVGADDARRLVLVSFGGFDSPAFDGREGDPPDALSDYLFVALEPGAPRDFPGEWIVLERPCPIAHEELVAACDALIGKAGFGSVAEALAHDTRFLYLPRADFPEVPWLQHGLQRHGCARPMPRHDFEAGRWSAHLAALFARPAPRCELACDADGAIADALLERLG